MSWRYFWYYEMKIGVPSSQESTAAASASATTSAAATGVAGNFSTGRRPILLQRHQCQALFTLTAKFLRCSCFGAGVNCHDCEEIIRPPQAILARDDERRMELVVTDAGLLYQRFLHQSKRVSKFSPLAKGEHHINEIKRYPSSHTLIRTSSDCK